MSKVKTAVSSICSAFEKNAIGSKVIGVGGFVYTLEGILQKEGIPEKPGFVTLPAEEFQASIRSGVALEDSLSLEDIHNIKYRGKWKAFADPRKAMNSFESLEVLLYPARFYLEDGQVSEEEKAVIREDEIDIIVVAIHAGPGDLDPDRLVANMAGGNKKFMPTGDTEQDIKLLYELEEHAKKSAHQHMTYMTVADRT